MPPAWKLVLFLNCSMETVVSYQERYSNTLEVNRVPVKKGSILAAGAVQLHENIMFTSKVKRNT